MWWPELDAAAPNARPDLSMAENTSLVAKSGKAAGARLSETCWSLASPSAAPEVNLKGLVE